MNQQQVTITWLESRQKKRGANTWTEVYYAGEWREVKPFAGPGRLEGLRVNLTMGYRAVFLACTGELFTVGPAE